MSDPYSVIEATLGLLKLIHEKLPDKPRLGFTLFLVGAIFLGATHFLPYAQDWRIGVAVLIFSVFLVGGACCLLGGYILFRRAIWMWQDRRTPRTTNLRWK